jgi:hypothetical protein
MFEISLEGMGASAQDIEALRRIRALIASKSVAAQQEQEMRPSSSQAQPSQQQDAVPPHTAPDSIDFNIRQAERYLALLQSQIAGTTPPQQVIPAPPAPHRRLPRMLRRRPSSTPGTPCRPCRPSWISGGSRRTLPKGKASATARRGGRRRSTSHPMMHHFATSSRCPHSQSSSRVRRGPVVSMPTPCPVQ